MFFKKILLLLILLLICDFIIGNILRFFYFKQESGLQYRTTYSIDSTKAEVIILGSSRANHHYHPDIFENQLKMTYYNAGRDGCSKLYHYAVLKGILKRYSPKIVILDFLSREFQTDQSDYDKLSILLPYYKDHPAIHSIVDLQGQLLKIKLLSSIYPFNSSLLTIMIGNSEFNKKRKEDIKGYIPLIKVWGKPLNKEENEVETYKTDSIKIRIFKSFINECQKSNVKIYVICSPYFYKQKFTDYSVRIAKAIADRENVVFWDYSQDSTFLQHPTWFQDIGHLNNNGAIKFSKLIVTMIKHDKKREMPKIYSE